MSHRIIMLAFLAACASGRDIASVRFANAPAARVVDDRRDVARPPEPRPFGRYLYELDGVLTRPVVRTLELQPARRALGVNALDEAPDSTWFTNRIGVRALSREELDAGPITIASPEQFKPWTITSTKSGGAEIGFVMRDARGIKFLLKFDRKGFPEQETAAHMIVSRALWAAGYHVPEDFLVSFRPEELALAADAKVDGAPDGSLDTGELARRLAQVEHGADGAIRAIASRLIAGTWLGGPPAEGVRDDDPNDRIPHQLRRDLRGVYPIAAWLDHVDIKEDNFLDMWVADRGDPARHYVEHYMVDFGNSLGVMATSQDDPRHGFQYWLDGGELLRAFVGLGIDERRWERRSAPALRGIAMFDAATFDPGGWKSETPAHAAFVTADRFDKFWGAKLIMRFTRDQLRAIVAAARYGDPRAADYVVDTLIARQRATGAHWFTQVNPLDRFEASSTVLCFDDLAIVYKFATPAGTGYRIAYHDNAGRLRHTVQVAAAADGRTCTTPQLADDGNGYTIAAITTLRPQFAGRTDVHLARDPVTSLPRVIGVWRE